MMWNGDLEASDQPLNIYASGQFPETSPFDFLNWFSID